MGSPIGMDDWPFLAVGDGSDGCIQHGVDETRIWLGSDGPADDHAVKAVDDGRKVHLASWDLELGDVCQPFHVRRFFMEVAIDQVLGRWTDLSQIGSEPPTTWSGNDQLLLLHQSLDNLFRDYHALSGQRRLQSLITLATTVRFKDFRETVTDGGILVCQTQAGAVIEVGASGNSQLGEQFRQAIAFLKGVNQLCLLPITQDLQIDAQVFFYEFIGLLQEIMFEL